MPCVISASVLFCVETRGVDRILPLPLDSSADSATSRLKAPLIDPSARPTALVGPATPRLTAVPSGVGLSADGRIPPATATLFGKARLVVFPSAGVARPAKPQVTPS